MNNNTSKTSFNSYISLIDEFKKFLEDLNIEIPDNSYLSNTFENIYKISKYNAILDNQYIILPFSEDELRSIAFLPFMLRSLDNIKKHKDAEKLRNHFKLFTETKFAQNDSTLNLNPSEWKKVNSIWELDISIALINISASIIYIENPYESNNKSNVDIITEIDNVIWGIECKVPTTEELIPLSFKNLIEKGVSQIDVADVDCGIVCLNLRNLIKHNNYLKYYGNDRYSYFDNKNEAISLLNNEIKENYNLLSNVFNEIFENNKIYSNSDKIRLLEKEIFKNSNKASKGWLNYYATAAVCYHDKSMNIEMIQKSNPQGLIQEQFVKENKLVNQINNGLFNKPKNYNTN